MSEQTQMLNDLNAIHVMFDIETGGTVAGCPIYQIAAVPFYLKNCGVLDLDSPFCEQLNRTEQDDWFEVDPLTMKFWEEQPEDTKSAVFSGTKSADIVLRELTQWFENLATTKDSIYVWGNGADFDLALLSYHFSWAGLSVPWKYPNTCCFRTLKNVFPAAYKNAKTAVGENKYPHHALHDAIWQSRIAKYILDNFILGA